MSMAKKIKSIIFERDMTIKEPVSYTHLDVYKRQEIIVSGTDLEDGKVVE